MNKLTLPVEELTKTVEESGLLTAVDDHYVLRGPLPSLAIPATLQDSLMARLDRLATVREIAQLGAALGREFSYELLSAIAPVDEETLHQGLQQLVRAELVYQRGVPPRATYLFKHALIRDAAYQSLLKSTRQQYHGRIARVLAEHFGETVETQPEVLAYHYTEAGLSAQALPYWQQAGQKAIERSAHVEAISHLTKGLELLKTLPDTPERVQQELTLQITLSGPLNATKGYAAPEVAAAYTRARELCQQIGETPYLFQVLLGLFSFHIVRMECTPARELAEQCLTVAQSVQDPDFLIEAHRALGQCLSLVGEFVSAKEHLEQSIALYGPHPHHAEAFFWTDPGQVSRSWAALTLWFLGYPDQALKRAYEALTLARELSNIYNLAAALGRAAMLHHLRQDREATQARAEETIALATEQGFPFFSMQSAVLQGWTQVEQGQTGVGITQMCQGMKALQDMGVDSTRPYHLALLAEVYGKTGQVEEGLIAVAEALELVNKTGERFYEAELYRVQGVLTLKQCSVPDLEFKVQQEAEACFQRAIEVARRQSAKSLELRATINLSGLWQQQGKRHDAYTLLSEVYGWFTEGFDTTDLQEAKALLVELTEDR